MKSKKGRQPDEAQSELFSTTSDDYIEGWDEYFLALATTAARKSKDPRCGVGAVLVRDKIVVATGFNGLARGVYDSSDVLDDVEEKLKLICHAELNASVNAARIGVSFVGATMYVTKFPCLACCNAIVQAGVARLYAHDNRFWDDDPADRDHKRKKDVPKYGRIDVNAPFHPEYGVAARQRKPPRRAQHSAGTIRPERQAAKANSSAS